MNCCSIFSPQYSVCLDIIIVNSMCTINDLFYCCTRFLFCLFFLFNSNYILECYIWFTLTKHSYEDIIAELQYLWQMLFFLLYKGKKPFFIHSISNLITNFPRTPAQWLCWQAKKCCWGIYCSYDNFTSFYMWYLSCSQSTHFRLNNSHQLWSVTSHAVCCESKNIIVSSTKSMLFLLYSSGWVHQTTTS